MSIFQAPPRPPYGHVPDNLDSDDNADGNMSLYSDDDSQREAEGTPAKGSRTTLAATTAATTPAKATAKTTGKHARPEDLDNGQIILTNVLQQDCRDGYPGDSLI